MTSADEPRIVKFARQELGITLTPTQAEMLSTFDESAASVAIWRCGRRGGKSLLADILVLADVALRDDLRAQMRPGEVRVASVIAPRIEQARQHIERCAQLLAHSPRLSRLLTSRTSDELVFANGSAIRAYPCSARTIRGDSWSLCVLDELAHFIDGTDGPQAADRVLEAAVPALAQFGDAGRLVAISTPLWRSGAFHMLVERATSGRFDASHHYRHVDTATMNPAIPAAWLARQREMDPDLYAREFEAAWVDGASSFLSATDVMACLDRGRGTLPPVAGVRYEAAIDPAYAHDSFAMAVGHREDGLAVIDAVLAWRKQGHEVSLDNVAAVAKRYGIQRARTDQFCAIPVLEGLSRRGVVTSYRPWTNQSKASAFTRLRAAVQTHTVALPDDLDIVSELCSLEQKPTPGGAFRIGAAPGKHDDRSVIIAAVVEELLGDATNGHISGVIDLDAALAREDGELPGGSRGWHRVDDGEDLAASASRWRDQGWG